MTIQQDRHEGVVPDLGAAVAGGTGPGTEPARGHRSRGRGWTRWPGPTACAPTTPRGAPGASSPSAARGC